MIIQVQQLIKSALQDIGAVAKSEMPTPDEMTDGLRKLNFMIAAWSVRSLMVLGAIIEGFSLTPGKQSYTMGIGGNFNSSRPSKITDAYVRNSAGEDTDVDILTMEEWGGIEGKSLDTGTPLALWYDPGATQQTAFLGTIWLYPMPDSNDAYTLFLGEQKALTEFSGLTDAVTFQPAYYEALEYNLAIRLWRHYHEDARPIPPDIVSLAQDAMRTIETMNAKQVTAKIEAPGRKTGGYNIYNFSSGNQ